jgi:hypothetical protein
MHLLA